MPPTANDHESMPAHATMPPSKNKPFFTSPRASQNCHWDELPVPAKLPAIPTRCVSEGFRPRRGQRAWVESYVSQIRRAAWEKPRPP
jgi:hypothetical protein